ncbi:hypothetical protein B9479_005004 [Cryptococcus floricola]|uniref:Uncharacterized protein n=1 Tax=Cryptococcus floricola TaxID=2591691 RepID=A0A5D3AVS4_9TREE|nr:hypothetical protein B9479_005004 [Cryptococcus floricola]
MADILTRVTGVPVGTPQITKEFFYSDAHKPWVKITGPLQPK